MIWVLMGAAVGVAWLLLGVPAGWTLAPLDAVIGVLSDFGSSLVVRVAGWFGAASGSGVVGVLVALLAVAATPIACLLLAEALSAARQVQRILMVLSSIGAVGGYWLLPAGQATLLLGAVLLLNLLLAVGVGSLLSFPAAIAVTALCGRLLWMTVLSAGPALGSADTVSAIAGGSSGLWLVLMSGLSVVLASGAIVRLFVRPARSDD